MTKKLTIGMACYDDFDGVYFTVQALNLYHGLLEPYGKEHIEVLVVDSHPKGCVETAKAVDMAGGRYLHLPECAGTAAPRDRLFKEARGEIVLCIDCHVLLWPNALSRVLAYFADAVHARDMLHGVLAYDDAKSFATHMTPTWGAHMFGQWEDDPRQRTTGFPFEIRMHGLGLFAMKRDCWVGFNPRFRGFGGEEGYVHDKVRKAGGKVVCHPELLWTHRFQRPKGVPYKNDLKDRFFNYLLGRHELGLPINDVFESFRDALTEEQMYELKEEVERPLAAVAAREQRMNRNVAAAAGPTLAKAARSAWPKPRPAAERPKAPPEGEYKASVNVNRTIDGDKSVAVRAEIKIDGPVAPVAFDLADVMVSPDGTKLSVGLKEVE